MADFSDAQMMAAAQSYNMVPSAPMANYAKPGPYITDLGAQEPQFQNWVKQNNIPFNDSPQSDYDMRGYYKKHGGKIDTTQNVSDGLPHFEDTFKTPWHKSFSNESQYALPTAPHWAGNDQTGWKTVDNSGKVFYNEGPPIVKTASTVASPNFSDDQMLQAAQSYGMLPKPNQLEGNVASNNFLDALGAGAHGLAEGGYRTADLALRPFDQFGRGLYKAATGQDPQEQMSVAKDFNSVFTPPQQFQPLQAVARSILPGMAANFIAPGSGIAQLAANGAVGNALTSAGDQLAQSGKINPFQVASEATLGAVVNPIATKALNALGRAAGKIIPGMNKNAATSPIAIPNAPQQLAARTNLSVIDPRFLEPDEAAAHSLMNTNIQLPPAVIAQVIPKDTKAIAAASKIAKQQAQKEQALNLMRQFSGNPMGSYPLQSLGPVREFPMIKPTVEAQSPHNYLDTSHLNPKPMGSYPLMHVGSVHELSTSVGKLGKQAPGSYANEDPLIPHVMHGDLRFRRLAFGHKKVFQDDVKSMPEVEKTLERAPGFDASRLQAVHTNLLKLKAKRDYDEHLMQDFGKKLIDKYGGDSRDLKEFGIRVYEDSQQKLHFENVNKLATYRNSLPIASKSETKDSVSTILGGKFGHEPEDFRLIPEELSGDKKQDFKRLLELRDNLKGSKKRGVETGSDQEYEQAQKAAIPLLREAHIKLQEVTGDPESRYHVAGEVRHPMGRQFGMLPASVEYTHGKTITKLTEEAQADYERFEQQLLAAEKDPKYKKTIKVDARSASLAAGAFLMSLDQGAQAADGKTAGAQDRTLRNIGIALTASAIIGKFGPAAAREFLENKHLFFASTFFKDSLDHFEYLDSMLGKTGKGLVREILQHNASALQSQFGVKFASQNAKAFAYKLLKEKAITPIEALAGKAGTVFEKFTPEQRKAVVEYHLNRSTLAGKVAAYKQEVKAHIKQNNVDNFLAKDAMHALDVLHDALKPTAFAQHPGEQLLNKLTSNAMDYFFFLAPKFHLLNLADQWMSGASRTGALNIFKANTLLATDKDIAKAFGHSNIVGSFKAERMEQAARAGRTVELPDIPSDKINADRVALASFLDYFDKNPQKMRALAYTKQSQFVKAVLSGNAEPSVTMDAWTHVSEIAMRTLGVDPFKINQNFVSRMKTAPALGVFVNQPARIARLTVHNLAKGDLRGVYTMLGATVLIGGKAVVPSEIRSIWAAFDPDGSFQAQKDLDNLSIVRGLTGMDVSAKVETNIFYPAQAALSPAYTNLLQAPDTVAGIAKAAMALKDAKTWQDVVGNEDLVKATDKLFALTSGTVAPRVAGLPTQQIAKVIKTAGYLHNGKQQISYHTPNAKFPLRKADEFDMQEMNISPFDVVKEAVLPGSSTFASDLLQAEKEREARKFRGLVDQGAPVYDRADIIIGKQKK